MYLSVMPHQHSTIANFEEQVAHYTGDAVNVKVEDIADNILT